MVSVIITTCNRAEFLREALESLRRQTARQEIGQVIVSENSLADESENVCRRFPDLPILYLQQRPPVPALFHLQAIWKNVQHPLVAFLHDDDWWAPEHLARALQALESNPDCVAAFSSHFWTDGPEYPAEVCRWAWRVWAVSGCDFSAPVLNLTDEEVFLVSFLSTSFHYSTMVGAAEAVWESYRGVLASRNEYDNDRTFPVFLASRGHVAYLTAPDVYIRIHKGRHSARFARHHRSPVPRLIETTRWMAATWPATLAASVEKFNLTIASLDRRRQAMVADVEAPLKSVLIKEFGMKLPRPPRLKWFLRQVCPSGLLPVMSRLSVRLGLWSH